MAGLGKCIVCGKSTRRLLNSRRPCCRKCEKTAPTVFTAPGLFTRGPAAKVAEAIMRNCQKGQ